jgi:hypothetical protein
MAMQILMVQKFGTMWQVTLDGTTVVCALDRAQAIASAGHMLRLQLTDSEFLANLELSGLELHELFPPVANIGAPHPPATIDFDEAKRRIEEKWLPIAAQRVGTAVAIIDELCVEYDWGWVIYWKPINPELGKPDFVNEYHFPFTVDRVTGNTGLSGGTYGIERGIVELLQWRPPHLCGPYPPGRTHWLRVYDQFKAAGAFEPRRTCG